MSVLEKPKTIWPFVMELTEEPAPGTSPEAPDGPAYKGPDVDPNEHTPPSYEDQKDIFRFPEDDDSDE